MTYTKEEVMNVIHFIILTGMGLISPEDVQKELEKIPETLRDDIAGAFTAAHLTLKLRKVLNS